MLVELGEFKVHRFRPINHNIDGITILMHTLDSLAPSLTHKL